MGQAEKKEKYSKGKELGLPVKWTMSEAEIDRILQEHEGSPKEEAEEEEEEEVTEEEPEDDEEVKVEFIDNGDEEEDEFFPKTDATPKPVAPIANADFYRDNTLTTKRIGKEFSECSFNWNFPGQEVLPKNDSIVYDIEYSFDGNGVAGRLRKGTNALKGGEWKPYSDTSFTKIYFRIAHDEFPADPDDYDPEDAPYRLFVYRGA